MDYFRISCDDGWLQPLMYKVLQNGKYVLVRGSINHLGYVDEPMCVLSPEFDDIEIYNSDYGPAYVFVKKSGLWGMYRYSGSSDYDNEEVKKFFGRYLTMKERIRWASLYDLKQKYLRKKYRYKKYGENPNQYSREYCVDDDNKSSQEWLNDFSKAKKTNDYSEIHGLRMDIFRETKFLSGNYTKPEPSVIYDKEINLTENKSPIETEILVLPEDCLQLARDLKDENPLVLNMANRQHPGGGVESGAGAQEECLFRSSNYALTMYPMRKYYPLDRNFGGIYSPKVTVFRGLEKDGYPILEEPFLTNFVAVAALRNPHLINGKYQAAERQGMVNKIRTILGIAAENNHSVLILSALGCGAFHNPAEEVAKIFKEQLEDKDFKGRFKKVIFAIKKDHNDTQGNYEKFCKVFWEN